jgi:uncharacterized membrane-anchored protein YitT (DUF2179 family)
MAVGVNMIYEPLSMVTGGFSGFAIVIKPFTSYLIKGGIPVWVITTLLNVPLFIAAGCQKGIQYVKDTIFAVVCFTAAMAVIPIYPVVEEDYLMAALIGGAVSGFGLALVFAQKMSTGGTDLLSTLLQKYIPHITIAKILFFIDSLIVVFGIGAFGLRNGLYAIIAVFVTSKVMDGILEGLKFAKMAIIISESGEQIGKQVMEKLERGVTGLSVRGMFSGKNRMMLLCVVSRKEVVKVKEIVSFVDETAFVIVTDVREVKGEWIVKK